MLPCGGQLEEEGGMSLGHPRGSLQLPGQCRSVPEVGLEEWSLLLTVWNDLTSVAGA